MTPREYLNLMECDREWFLDSLSVTQLCAFSDEMEEPHVPVANPEWDMHRALRPILTRLRVYLGDYCALIGGYHDPRINPNGGRDCNGDHPTPARNGEASQEDPATQEPDETSGGIPRAAGAVC